MITQKQYDALEDMSISELTDLWNKVTGSKLKKFKSRGQGIARLQALYEEGGSGTDDDDSSADDVPLPKPKKARVNKRKTTDAQRFSGQIRVKEMIELLREDDYTAEELAEKFCVTYKSICNDLFNIRHRRHPEIKDDEELVRVKAEKGKKGLYGVVLRESE